MTLSFDQIRYFREYKPPDLQEIKRTDWNNIDCSGPLPVSMHKLESIETLYMKTLYFTGEIPQSLFQIPTLKRLEIYSLNRRISTNVNFLNTRTKVTGELNFINVAAINLKFLAISRTYLTGNIPIEIGNMKNLIKLDLSRNYLYGNITKISGGLKQLKNLKILNLAKNTELHGVLPKELLNRLDFLDISGTNITLDKDYDPEETKSLNCFIYSTTGNYTEQFRNTFSHKCRNMENKELTTWYVEFHKHFNNGGDPHLYLDYRWMDNPSLMSCREKFVV